NPNWLAAVRRGPREGTLLDATSDADLISLLLENLRTGQTVEAEHRRLEFQPTASLSRDNAAAITDVHAVETEQSNTTVLVGGECVVKLFRRLEPGINPEIDVGRFLTEIVSFHNAAPLLGAVELVENHSRSAVAAIHRFIENQGNAWSLTNAYLERYVEEQRLLT